MTNKPQLILLLIILLLPVLNYAQIIGVDIVKFVGEKSGEFRSKKTYEREIIIIYPDSTYEKNHYRSIGIEKKLDVNKASLGRKYSGYWNLENKKLYLYSKHNLNDSNLVAIFKVKSNQLIYKHQETFNQIDKYLVKDDNVETFDIIYGVKPIIHYKKARQ
ncbi:MAG: hypothetical protein H8E98_08045 [Bacteroidetes bacterium]|nr:hypothetical protein [Bacteroidota bacterium]